MLMAFYLLVIILFFQASYYLFGVLSMSFVTLLHFTIFLALSFLPPYTIYFFYKKDTLLKKNGMPKCKPIPTSIVMGSFIQIN
jgi:hypothetical protein